MEQSVIVNRSDWLFIAEMASVWSVFDLQQNSAAAAQPGQLQTVVFSGWAVLVERIISFTKTRSPRRLLVSRRMAARVPSGDVADPAAAAAGGPHWSPHTRVVLRPVFSIRCAWVWLRIIFTVCEFFARFASLRIATIAVGYCWPTHCRGCSLCGSQFVPSQAVFDALLGPAWRDVDITTRWLRCSGQVQWHSDSLASLHSHNSHCIPWRAPWSPPAPACCGIRSLHSTPTNSRCLTSVRGCGKHLV
jgi:hypothetical protein